jgi:D-sedoheptulose 7-phosphate isomerase
MKDDDYEQLITDSFSQSASLLSESAKYSKTILEISNMIVECLKNNNKVVLFGNGGSATDSDHFATELLGRYLLERQSLAAISITNSATISAIGNDYGFENIFSRQCESLVNENDVVIAISTSGNSLNVLKGIKLSNKKNAKTIAITGNDGGKLGKLSGISLIVTSNSTPRIQEVHRIVIHIICDIVEREFSNVNSN